MARLVHRQRWKTPHTHTHIHTHVRTSSKQNAGPVVQGGEVACLGMRPGPGPGTGLGWRRGGSSWEGVLRVCGPVYIFLTAAAVSYTPVAGKITVGSASGGLNARGLVSYPLPPRSQRQDQADRWAPVPDAGCHRSNRILVCVCGQVTVSKEINVWMAGVQRTKSDLTPDGIMQPPDSNDSPKPWRDGPAQFLVPSNHPAGLRPNADHQSTDPARPLLLCSQGHHLLFRRWLVLSFNSR
ncbi:hypothetical protein LY78DRAFT_489097 [Colletotrichum sublineola]|nr:hypothetical protein LY78DRAFT_489097 [Colletotrichum sublineola]